MFAYKIHHYLLVLLICTFDLKSHELRPVPWLTEEAIVFLENFCRNNANAKILEFGCGASTIWLSKKTTNLVSIEHNEEWYNFIINALHKNVDCKKVDLKLLPRPYGRICEIFPDYYFDLILIDGRDRVTCTKCSIKKLKKGGVLMLDNSERAWYRPIYHLLQEWQYYETEQSQPDMCGFWYKNWKTSWWIKPY